MAAFGRLLLRGLLAGRRVATAPTQQAPRAFSTTSTGGRHVPQSHRPSLERVVQGYMRDEQRNTYFLTAVTVVFFIVLPAGRLGPFAPHPPSKSVTREGRS